MGTLIGFIVVIIMLYEAHEKLDNLRYRIKRMEEKSGERKSHY